MKKEFTIISLFCALAIAVVVLNKPEKNLFESLEKEFEGEGYEFESEEEEEAKTDQPDRYFEFHRGIRTRDGAESPEYNPGHLAKEVKKGLAAARMRKNARAAGVPPSNGVTAWTERGPGNVPGRTRALLNLPGDANNNSWLAGAATGGIWKTVNGGTTWVEKSGDFPVMPISSFAISGGVIYAGTGEYVSTRLTAVGDGIFKSTDNGENWTQITSTAANEKFSIVTRVITDPADPNIILASTVRSFWSTVSNETSIMRSINGGTSWTEVYTTTGAIEQIIATPGDFQVQYASLNGVGVLKSIDGGATWSLSNSGMSPAGRLEIGVSPVNPNKLFASSEGITTAMSKSGSDLYVSSDAAQTWSLVDVKVTSTALDFLIGQGFYDNTILCDPFDENIVYYGGVSLFRSTLSGTTGTPIDDYKILEQGTSFIFLQSFTSGQWDNQRLNTGADANIKKTVEIRFGPGQTQKAHRFQVPANSTSGVPVTSYTYQDYIDVPFEVWDITAEPDRQLMVSFRDQFPNGEFDLVTQFLDASSPPSNSREYLYIHNVDYSTTNSPSISVAGGQEFNKMYNIFPCLAAGQTWDPNNLPSSKLTIQYSAIPKVNATTITVADSRGTIDGKNGSNQTDLNLGVHPDHHSMIPIVINAGAKTYKILLGNDGGPFVSNVSTTPGVVNGDWTWKGKTYITSQFYGADKKPGVDQYIGGMQDNGTRISKTGESASKTTDYSYAIGGDGFEVLWHSLDGTKILGSLYNNRIYKSTNAGFSFAPSYTGFTLSSTTGLPDDSLYPFFSRLAHSKNMPDRVFAIGTDGVWRSQDFGTSWTKTAITSQWTTNSTFIDVEVSAANANIVWAGAAITAGSRLHVSTDGGATFTATNNYTENMGVISKLGSHPTQENTAYALFSYANAPKILRTTDLGQTWEDISGFGTNDDSSTGFPDVAVYCIYVRPDNPNIIWVGTEIGIVESMDNGATWGLLDEFPNVAVWDMKGQDDQIVIATHGRGIWTATINASQQSVKTPVITQFGTSPKEDLMLKVTMEEAFDSVMFYSNATLLGTIRNVTPSELTVRIKNLTPGTKSINTVSYKGTAPFQSESISVGQLDILSIENAYATYFKTTNDLTASGFGLQLTEGEGPDGRRVMQTVHDYPNSSDLSILLRHPVKVSASIPTLYYRDIVLVEPSDVGAVFGTPEFQDYVVVEASKNGLDWTPLADGYNARSNTVWLDAYTAGQDGNRDMYVDHEIDLSDAFTAGDTLLIRYRLSSNETIRGWGVALSFITIQQEPTGADAEVKAIRKLSTFPNPSDGNFTAEYELAKPSDVSVTITDMQGKRIYEKTLGRKNAGVQRETFKLSNQQGTYLVVFKSNGGNEVSKMLIKK